MASELHITLLGQLHLARDGQPVEGFAYNKGLALLCYLATTGHAHSREALAGLLWGGLPDEAARANLRKVLTYLRQVVPDHLDITRRTVAFNWSAPTTLDVNVFESSLREIRPNAEPAVYSQDEVRLLAKAAELYRGDFLDGFYVHDAPDFEEWVLLQRERLHQMALHALHMLSVYHIARGAYDVAIRYSVRLLALEPWQEEYHQQMMLALALSGERSRALRQYEMCRQILQKELGVDPSADTVLLARQIQEGRMADRSLARPPRHLAAQMTSFFGREKELALIDSRLHDPACRLLTLLGITGIGKTRLALQAAAEVKHGFADGIYYVELPSPDAASCVVNSIVRAVGIPARGEDEDEERLYDHLRMKQALLVLDDVARLAEFTRPIASILKRAPGVKILATADAPLGLAGEWALQLDGLDYELSGSGGAGDSSALRLFVASAGRVQSRFHLTDAERLAAERICRLTDGLPLAIELAASWARLLPVPEIAREIERSMDFLSTDSQSLPERQRSMRAVFDYAWQHLNDECRAVFRRLSVFRGGFDRHAAEQVAGASLGALAVLVDRCLLQVSARGRYSIHAVLLPYAAEELACDPQDQSATRNRHSEYYRNLVWQKDATTREELAAAQERESENIKAAWAWLCQSAQPGTAECEPLPA